jgi:hypothetical protein
MRKRVSPQWRIEWNRKIEIWTLNQVKRNMWRFDPIDTYEDVMQEAKLLFYTLTKKYPIVIEIAIFFTLYKASLSNMFIDKTRKKSKSIETHELLEDVHLHGIPNYGYMNLLVDELPDDLKLVLKHLTGGRIRRTLDRPTPKSIPRENHNMRLRRKLPIALIDPVGDLKRFIQS